MKKLIKNNKNLVYLTLILILALGIRLVFFTGIGVSDSLFFTKFAYEFSTKNVDFSQAHQASRIGLLYPISILYKNFGVNEFSSNILVLLISLSSIVLIYKFGKLLFDEKIGLLSAFLLSFFPLDIVYSTRLMTDLPSAFFVALSIYLFLKSEKINKNPVSNTCCFFSGLSLGIAYLIREFSLLIGLFFIIYIAYHKKIKISYFLIALGFVLMVSVESLYFLNETGDPLFRYSFMSSKWTDMIVETNMYGRGNLPFSLFHYPYIIFTYNLLCLFYPFIFIAIFYSIVFKKKETHALLFWFIPLLLYTSFGSASISRYIPIPAAPRFLFIITMPGILLLSFFLSQNEPLIKKILAPSIIAILILSSIGYIYLSEHRSSLDNIKNVYKNIKSLPKKQIYTDERSVIMLNYLSGYKENRNIKGFHHYEFLNSEKTYALDLSQIEDSYVVLNWEIINFFESSKKGIKFPDEIYKIPKNWILDKEIGRKGKSKIDIYYVP